MHRLYLQIYMSLIGILILFGILAAVLWLLASPSLEDIPLFEGLGAIAGELIPGTDQPAEELQSALEKLGRHLPADLNVRGPDGALLARIGASLPTPRPGRTEGSMRSRWDK